jgi:hypothetical protein
VRVAAKILRRAVIVRVIVLMPVGLRRTGFARRLETMHTEISNLGLADFELDIRSFHSGFRYEITFRFAHTRQPYRGEGTAPSPGQCYDAAMAFMAECLREAVTE